MDKQLVLAVIVSVVLSAIIAATLCAGLGIREENHLKHVAREVQENITRQASDTLSEISSAKREVSSAVEDVEKYLEEISSARDKAVAKIEQARDEALDEIYAARGDALKAIDNKKDEAIQEISKTAKSYMDALGKQAKENQAALNQERDEAIAAINKAREEALKAILATRNQSIADLKAEYTVLRELIEKGNATTLVKELTEEPTKLRTYSIDLLFYFKPSFCCREDTNATVHVVIYINNILVLNKTLEYPSIYYEKYPPYKAHVELTAPYIANVRVVATGTIEGKTTGTVETEGNPYDADVTKLTVSIYYYYHASSTFDSIDIKIERAG